jgi:hypothetical protein
VIYIGIDDTDTPDTAGTNQLARRIAAGLPPGFALLKVLRHQLLDDPRVPYTSHNGSASIGVGTERDLTAEDLLPMLRREMAAWYVPGSDPGLCVAAGEIPGDVVEFGRRCQRQLVSQPHARTLAARHGILLEDFGGTADGVIGALAAVGLLAGGDDGRVVHLPGWSWPDPVAGCQSVDTLLRRGVDEVRDRASGAPVAAGVVDVGKHLRPAYRNRRVVLFVERTDADPNATDRMRPTWQALKLS